MKSNSLLVTSSSDMSAVLQQSSKQLFSTINALLSLCLELFLAHLFYSALTLNKRVDFLVPPLLLMCFKCRYSTSWALGDVQECHAPQPLCRCPTVTVVLLYNTFRNPRAAYFELGWICFNRFTIMALLPQLYNLII